nr:hypothetical protein [Tanacetum cinerariifolium]
MVLTKKVDKTPYELWHGKVPNLYYLKVWGCEAHVKRHTADKLKQRSVKCIFVGYPKETMGYYFYYPPANKVVVERYADLLEREFILQKESGRTVELDDEDTIPSENTSDHPIEVESLAPIIKEDVVPVRRSARTPKAPNRLCPNVEIVPDQLYFNVEVKEHSLGDKGEPASYKEALSDPEFEKWLVAMNAEIQSMYDNKVWKLVDLPPGAKVVKNYEETFSPVADIRAIRILIVIAAYYDYEICQMDVKTAFLNGFLDEKIYMEQPKGFVDPDHPRKTDMDGVVYIYKACLVAKDFTQTYGVDYEETFSPVADIRAIRILIVIAAYYDYEICQMDVKTAFLNGFLDEKIYMEQPKGFVDPDHPRKGTIPVRWMHRKKPRDEGVVLAAKLARLVAKGFTQTYGVDYEETFSPVADIGAIRILINIAAYYDYEIWQMNVKTAFLNGFLDEEIYMEQPEGFVDPDHPRK